MSITRGRDCDICSPLSGESSSSAPLAKQTCCHYRRGQLDLSRLQSSGLSSRLCILVYSVIIPNDLLKWPPHSKDPPWPNTVVTIVLLRWNSLPLESCECESTLQAKWCIKVSGFSFSTRFSILRCNENFLACQELRAQPTKHRDDIKCRIWETPKLNICFPWLYSIIRPAGNVDLESRSKLGWSPHGRDLYKKPRLWHHHQDCQDHNLGWRWALWRCDESFRCSPLSAPWLLLFFFPPSPWSPETHFPLHVGIRGHILTH